MRRVFVVILATIVFAFSRGANADTPCSHLKSPPDTSGCFEIKANEKMVLRLALTADPPVRVKVGFDRKDGKGHLEVAWEPNDTAGLRRRLLIPSVSADTTWCATVTTDPAPLVARTTGNNGDELRAVFGFDAWTVGPSAASLKARGAYHVEVSTFEKSKKPEYALHENLLEINADDSGCNAPKVDEAAKGLASATAGGSGTRAFEDTAATVANDVLQLVAEIVIERAKSKAFRLVRDLLVTGCTELHWPGDPMRPLLPETCGVIQHLELRDVASAASVLEKSLTNDFMGLISQLLQQELSPVATNGALKPVLESMFDLAKSTLVDRKLDRRQTQALLAQLATAVGKLPPSNEACALEVAMAVVATCHASSTCDGRTIEEMLSDPTSYFDAGGVCAPTTGSINLQTVVREWHDANQFVATALRIVEAAPNQSPKDTLRDVMSIGFDVVQRVARCTANDPRKLCGYISAARPLADAAIKGDTKAVIASASAIIEKSLECGAPPAICVTPSSGQRKAFRKVTALVSAISTYAAAFPTKSDGSVDPAALQANREARKKAIEDFMDATTDRADRDGDWVVSVGVMPGFITGIQVRQHDVYQQNVTWEKAISGMPPQLSLAAGVGIQKLPLGHLADGSVWFFRALGGYTGFHLQLSAIDLAQYVNYTAKGDVSEPRGDSFFLVGASVGALFGNPSSSIFVGVDARYAPTTFSVNDQPARGAFSLGGSIGYYVPIFDFN